MSLFSRWANFWIWNICHANTQKFNGAYISRKIPKNGTFFAKMILKLSGGVRHQHPSLPNQIWIYPLCLMNQTVQQGIICESLILLLGGYFTS